jgi:hypothetical protein
MPFSFSRLFLGKRATVTEEDVPPCRPREFMPVMVDATTTKAKFGLKKIGRALKHKLRLVSISYPYQSFPIVLEYLLHCLRP